MKPPSFNQWITLQSHPLALVWQPRRGRLTRAAVERRAFEEYGVLGGGVLYDQYLAAITPPEGDKALLDFDPSR
jgi:hypothetical protein